MSAVESFARPADSEELVLVLVASVPGVPLRVPSRVALSALRGLQGNRDHRAPARALGPASTDTATAANDDRSRLSCCSESGIAAVELAILPRHAENAAALAPPPRRPPVDVRRSTRST